MIYIKAETGVYIKYDSGTKRVQVLDKKGLEKELVFQEEQLASLPKPLDDKALLIWAKENYPQSDIEKSRTLIQTRIDELKLEIEGCK